MAAQASKNIYKRLQTYDDQTTPENALKEIIQEIALFGLWRADFFEAAAFQGGSSVNALFRVNRYTEKSRLSNVATWSIPVSIARATIVAAA